MSAATKPALRVGVVGCGVMGTDHARLLARQVSGAELTRVTDLDPGRAAALAEELGALTSPDGPALIAEEDVDAVVVASADATHAALVLAAAAAGKPVLCEKPLAPSLEEAAGVVRTLDADGTGHLVTLGFMRRVDPAHVELREALHRGAVGEPLLVHGTSRGVTAGSGATSEGLVTGSFVHEADSVPWLLGSPVTAVCWQAPGRSTGTDTASGDLQDPQLLLLRTADGVLTTVEVLLNARYGYDVRCEVVGRTGALALSEASQTTSLTTRSADLARTSTFAADWRPRFAEAYRRELQAWVDGVRGLEAPALATARDGLVAAAVCDAAVRSMRAAVDGAGLWTSVEVSW
ncbi:Gfo/Idh/MocA family oxidoreductase [Streptomyces sp. NP160]|uniref:Gfo/Idh/MocA family oxidoreductase n=1 Tax=Streptomyces sp. NP160 TaxID=2586637 RepID=UPI00214CA74E|nr:Gfo/Idh/MocA family oxidoreductase [Streptomyces sp. NP160]